jgi:ABC-type spermidine/putrescine transport system permease subunit II
MIDFCLEKNITPFLTFLYAPIEFSLLSLSEKQKVEVLEYYFSTLSAEKLLFSQRILKPLMRSLDKINYAYFLHQFHELTLR